MKLISWNIGGKVKGCEAHALALLDFAPDIITLQEVRPNAVPKLKAVFQAHDLKHVLDTTDMVIHSRRHYGVLIASRWPLEQCSVQFDIPFRERSLSVEIDYPGGKIILYTVHVPPGSSNGWKKIETFEGVFDVLSKLSDKPCILCGDFNTPKLELPDGEIVTWGQRVTKSGKVVMRPGYERWDLGERKILQGLENLGFINVFRALNGYHIQEKSWERIINKKEHGYRYDHVFAARELNPVRCRYLHGLRKKGLSDHSPIEVLFQP